jgi:hypothetical protein
VKRALLLLVVVLAGCGGGSSSPSKGDFKKQFAPVDAQVRAAGGEMAGILQNASKKTDVQLSAEIDAVSTHLGAATAKLAKLTPPDDLKDDYKAMRDSLDVIEGDLSSLSGAVSAHDAKRSESGARKLVRDSADVKTTANRVRRAVGVKPSP